MKIIMIRFLYAALCLHSSALFADSSRVVIVVPGAKLYDDHHARFIEGGDIFENLKTDPNADYISYDWSGSMLTSEIISSGYGLALKILDLIGSGKNVVVITFSTGAQVAGAALRLLVQKPIKLNKTSLTNTIIGLLQGWILAPESYEEKMQRNSQFDVLKKTLETHIDTPEALVQQIQELAPELNISLAQEFDPGALAALWDSLQKDVTNKIDVKRSLRFIEKWGSIDVVTVGAPFNNPLDPTTNINEETGEAYGPINVALIKNLYSTGDFFILGAGSQFKDDRDPRTFYIEVKFKNGSKSTPFSVEHYYLLRNEVLGRRLLAPLMVTEEQQQKMIKPCALSTEEAQLNRLDWILPYEEPIGVPLSQAASLSQQHITIDSTPSVNCCGRTTEQGTCLLL